MPKLDDYNAYPGMVRWFDPRVLLDAARRAIVSALFGQYADRRLIQAALDAVPEPSLLARGDLTGTIRRHPDGAIWLDYVADLGDGFDSTYAIAYLLGRSTLQIDGAGSLPRGQLLIMGGDEVYPTATRDEYLRRLRRPYEHAFPDSDAVDAVHPPVLLIPGNHDWYDGLTLFLALFCRGSSHQNRIGSWRTMQHRSYFAVQLPDNWWIWGVDSQLGEDIDQPQADYFVAIARSMPAGAKIIICAAVPSWLYAEINARNAEERAKFYRGLDYIANIIRNSDKGARVCAVLSGDTHHYSRYSGSDGTQFIVAGGGGAFLHPTHQLVDTIKASWMRQSQTLSLKTEPGTGHRPTENLACYPQPEESRRLLWGNLKFAVTNWSFCLTLGVAYWIAALTLLIGRDRPLSRPAVGYWEEALSIACTVVASPMFLIVALTFVAVLSLYADRKARRLRWILGMAHAVPHLLVILVLVSLLSPFNVMTPSNLLGDLVQFITFGIASVLLGGFTGGFIWGIYLIAVCYWRGWHANDAFSAMRLDGYKCFLRICIKENELTIFPIGLDSVPHRADWRINPKGGLNQDEPIVEPGTPLRPQLIERPIVVLAD